jgi:hypothetical protein
MARDGKAAAAAGLAHNIGDGKTAVALALACDVRDEVSSGI